MDRSAFDQFTRLETTHWWFAGRRRLYPALLRGVLEKDGALGRPLAIADLGCGVGGFLKPLAPLGPVVGLELDEDSVGHCRARGFLRTAVAACDRLPFAPASLDLVCLFDVLEHLPDEASVLEEVRRTLRPGGHVAVSVPAYPWLYANNDRVAHHHRRYTRGALVARLVAAGLELRKATYVNVPLSVLIIPAVLAIKAKEKLLPKRDDPTTNLSWPVPRPVNSVLARLFGWERHLWTRASAPFGHSLFAVARRPPA